MRPWLRSKPRALLHRTPARVNIRTWTTLAELQPIMRCVGRSVGTRKRGLGLRTLQARLRASHLSSRLAAPPQCSAAWSKCAEGTRVVSDSLGGRTGHSVGLGLDTVQVTRSTPAGVLNAYRWSNSVPTPFDRAATAWRKRLRLLEAGPPVEVGARPSYIVT